MGIVRCSPFMPSCNARATCAAYSPRLIATRKNIAKAAINVPKISFPHPSRRGWSASIRCSPICPSSNEHRADKATEFNFLNSCPTLRHSCRSKQLDISIYLCRTVSAGGVPHPTDRRTDHRPVVAGRRKHRHRSFLTGLPAAGLSCKLTRKSMEPMTWLKRPHTFLPRPFSSSR